MDSGIAPLVAGFVIAVVTTPVGVSGAFLLLPFQVSVMGLSHPGVTATNLLFNVFSTPGGILTYRSQKRLDLGIVWLIVRGAVPGIVLGSLLRVTVFEAPGAFRLYAGIVLLLLGMNLVYGSLRGGKRRDAPPKEHPPDGWVTALAACAGVAGGIYGISGGSIVAPVLVGVWGLPVRRVGPAVLASTFVTSVTAVISFLLLDAIATGADPSRSPDWTLAAMFGAGGLLGSITGARFAGSVSEDLLRLLLAGVALAVGCSYVLGAL